jgi:alpha-L-arabinofuranosidase
VEYGASISSDPGWTLTSPALVNSLYAPLAGTTPLEASISGNATRTLSDGNQLAALDVVATRGADGGVHLVVVNRDEATAVTARVDVAGAASASSTVAVAEFNGADVLSYPSPQQPDAVRIARTTEDLVPSSFTRTFPAHSVTVLDLPGR